MFHEGPIHVRGDTPGAAPRIEWRGWREQWRLHRWLLLALLLLVIVCPATIDALAGSAVQAFGVFAASWVAVLLVGWLWFMAPARMAVPARTWPDLPAWLMANGYTAAPVANGFDGKVAWLMPPQFARITLERAPDGGLVLGRRWALERLARALECAPDPVAGAGARKQDPRNRA